MNTSRSGDRRAAGFLLLTGLCSLLPAAARAQFATVLTTNSRYAGNSTGTSIYSGDTGTASSTSLNAPSYAVFDSLGNLYVSDTANNCVRKVDTGGNVTTVAGLRVNGGPDTCNTAGNPAPVATQGLLAPTGLAMDSANTLYIADSQHHCVRSLVSGAADSFAANALTTVAGTCTSMDTASVTPAPNGLAIDGSGNLYISVQDTATALPVNQVLRHAAGAASTSVCYLAGQPSANVATACAGVTGSATLSSPAGLALDVNGNLFLADTGNNCVREIAALATLQTAVGKCANDGSGSASTALTAPYGLAFSPSAALYISEDSPVRNNVVSFAPGSGTLTLVAGLPSGTPGAYSALLDGQSSLNAPLDAPMGLTTDTSGNVYLADSLNNVVREMSTGLIFPATGVGSASATQIVTFEINQTVNLTETAGTDYTLSSTTCSGLLLASAAGTPPNTCQAVVSFSPSRPGARSSALQLKDSVSGSTVSAGLGGTGTGPLSLLTPGNVASVAANLRNPIAVSVDAAGNTYVLEQGNGTTSADVLLVPAGGGAARTVVAQGAGLQTPTAMAIDGAGNIFVADAAFAGITRFGADGSVNTSYVTGVANATAIALDGFDNLYIAQGSTTHNVIEVYASGTRRVIAGSGSAASANGVAASSALFVSPSGLALGASGLYIADSTGYLVYLVDSTGTIHIVAGNGGTTTTAAGTALGTALLAPVGLSLDAAGDLYIADEAANRVYEVYPVSSAGINITSPLGTGQSGYTGDGGAATAATLNSPLTIGIDGSSDLFVIDSGNAALREVSYPVTSTLAFGYVVIGTTSKAMEQTVANAGNAGLMLTTPFVPSDTHYAVSASASLTTCNSNLASGATCTIGFTFTPTVLGPLPAQTPLPSNSYNTPLTVQFTAFGINSQNLPYTLTPETEVYGQAFTETATINIAYPDLVPTGTMSYNIAGELTCTIGGPFPNAVNCPATESGLGVGTYQVNFVYTSGDLDYFSTTGTTTLTVTPGALTVTPANETKAYGAAIPALPATITGAVNGDLFLKSQTTTATATSPVGTYPITSTLTPVGLASLNNYTVIYNTGTLTVTPIPLAVSVLNATRTYGAANPVFASTVVGTANGDVLTINYSTAATVTSPVGTYPITATVTGAASGNYTVTVVPGTLTITPAPLTVNVANASRAYGAVNPSFSGTITGALNGDTFTNTYSTTATISSPVGMYPITDVLSGAAAANYTVTVSPGTLTITATTLALNIAVNNATRLYGAANPSFSSTVTGALNGDTFTITYATAATASSPVGSYAIVPTVSGAALGNYASVTIANGTLTVTAAPLTVAVVNATRVYGAANPNFASVVTGLANGDVLSISYATTAVATSPVGAYPISPLISGAPASNYAITLTPGTLTVTAASLTVTVADASRAYGSANPVFTSMIAGAMNGDTFNDTYSTAATIFSPVGAYPITDSISGSNLANYTVTVVPGTLTITQATAALTIAANNVSRPYGSANPGFSGTLSGALNGDTFTVTYSTTATPGSAVGGYAIVPSVSGAALSNYANVVIVNGTLTVTPVALTLAVANATRVYGAANPTFASTISGGVNGDTFTVIYSTIATAASPVGTYPIMATLGGANAADYTVTVAPGILTVTAAALTVTVANATRGYGAPNPAFTSTVTGALNSDTFVETYSTPATIASPAGTYAINDALSGTAAANYTVTVVPGTLTITPATVPLAVTVNNAMRVYGGANPVFTSTIAGALNGDTFTVTYSTPATAGSPVGSYPIVATVTGAALSNYTLVTNNGTLTVTPATLTIAVSNATRLYGAGNPTLTGTMAGLVNGDTLTVAYTTTAAPASPVGAYPIVASVTGAALSNYTLAVAGGTLTVTPAPLNVAANNSLRMYGTSNPVFSGVASGLLNGDTVAIGYATPATPASPVGTYPIVPTVTGAALSNYTLTTSNGVLTISDATGPLVVTVNNAARAYGAANPVFTGTVAGLLNGDTVTVTYSTAANAASTVGTYPITATVTGAAAANYIVSVVPGTLTVTPAATSTAVVTSGSPAFLGASITFTATVSSSVGVPGGTVSFLNGTAPLGTATPNGSGVATFTISTLQPGSYSISAVYQASTDYAASSGELTQIVSMGTFTVAATPPTQFVRGPGTTVYTVTLASMENFSGPVTLSCSGLPSDATCNFASPIVTLAVGGTATTTMTVVNTAADARLEMPAIRGARSGTLTEFAPLTAAAVFPFELTGMGVFLAGLAGRRKPRRRGRLGRVRLMLALLCTIGMLGLAGCTCFTSIYKNYTINITGTSSAAGVEPQTATVLLSVAQQ